MKALFLAHNIFVLNSMSLSFLSIIKKFIFVISLIVLPNIASHKPAAQSSTKNKYNASYAVDGNRGTNVGVDNCAHTADGDMNPWWRVDLQDVYKVSSVRILNRGKDQYNTGKAKNSNITKSKQVSVSNNIITKPKYRKQKNYWVLIFLLRSITVLDKVKLC